MIRCNSLNQSSSKLRSITPESVEFTIPSTGWTSSTNGYTKSITVSGASTSAVGIVGLSQAASKGQRKVYMESDIFLSGQSSNALSFTAQSVPSQDIPMVLNLN